MDACQGHILFLFELQIGNANPRFLSNCSPPVSHESRGDYLSRKGSLRGEFWLSSSRSWFPGTMWFPSVLKVGICACSFGLISI